MGPPPSSFMLYSGSLGLSRTMANTRCASCEVGRRILTSSTSGAIKIFISMLAALLLPSVAAAAPLRIMPFGDSITVWDCRTNAYTGADDKPIFHALENTPGNAIYPNGTYFIVAPGGYRGHLATQLGDPALNGAGASGAGPAWSFVGSSFLCGAHEGYSGETVEWLANRTTDIMTKGQPDIVTFMAGTNDFFWDPPQGTRSPQALIARLGRLLDLAFAAVPSTTFLVSTITHINSTRCSYYHTAHWHPPNCPDDMQANIIAYNKLLPALVAQYKAKGHDIALHDVNADAQFVAADYWIWGIHFNTTGFEKMAASWTKAITASRPWRARLSSAASHPSSA
jgi:lysophospholipase L1-like esterase